MIQMMQKDAKREKMEKLQKKLEMRRLSMFEALTEDVVIEWLKTNNPAFMPMLNQKTMIQLINYVIVPGPPDNRLRSYKLPLAATQVLSSMHVKISQLMLQQDDKQRGDCLLGHLLTYFTATPNHTISGYVVKILMNLMVTNAPRVLEYLMKNLPERMIQYIDSQSIAEFFVRIIVVEDPLINNQIKERIQLLNTLIDIYAKNQLPEEILLNVNFVLCQCIVRLWTNKHKELGRFAAAIFRLVEIVIDSTGLCQQENLIGYVMRHLTEYQKEAQAMIIALYKKIYNDFLLNKTSDTIRTQAQLSVQRFTQKRYKYLQTLHHIFLNSPQVIAKQLTTSNIFSFLFEFIIKHEWNSIMLVEIEKILRATIACGCQAVYYGLTRGYFFDKLKQLVRAEATDTKFGHGYSGLLKNLILLLHDNFKAGLPFALYMKKNHQENQMANFVQDYINRHIKPLTDTDSYKVIHDVAKPFYNTQKLIASFKDFFDEAGAINARMQMDCPSLHSSKSKHQEQLLHEIENENELVYQLLTQTANENVEQKKTEEINQ